MNKKNFVFRAKGYTLLETLLALLLFSMIVSLSSLILSQSIKYYQNLIQPGLSHTEYTKIFWLEKSFASLFDYYIYDDKKQKWLPLFIETRDKIVYTSLFSLFSNSPVLVILEKVNMEGKYSLIYYETPLYTLTLKDVEKFLALLEYKHFQSFTFFTDLDKLDFQYYIYDSFRKDFYLVSEYNKEIFSDLPQAIQIEYSKDGMSDSIYAIINLQTQWKSFYNERYQKDRKK